MYVFVSRPAICAELYFRQAATFSKHNGLPVEMVCVAVQPSLHVLVGEIDDRVLRGRGGSHDRRVRLLMDAGGIHGSLGQNSLDYLFFA
jgi:hypothetical protein